MDVCTNITVVVWEHPCVYCIIALDQGSFAANLLSFRWETKSCLISNHFGCGTLIFKQEGVCEPYS